MWKKKIITIKKIINFIIANVRWGEQSAQQTIIIITFYSENFHKNEIKKKNGWRNPVGNLLACHWNEAMNI